MIYSELSCCSVQRVLGLLMKDDGGVPHQACSTGSKGGHITVAALKFRNLIRRAWNWPDLLNWAAAGIHDYLHKIAIRYEQSMSYNKCLIGSR